MPITDDQLPPVPRTTEPIDQLSPRKVFVVDWAQWFEQLRIKVNIINSAIVNLAGVTGAGILVKNGAAWVLRTLQGTPDNISVNNGDGSGGDPTIDLVDTAVTPGTYGDSTHVAQIEVDQKGRITSATEVLISGGGGGGAVLQALVTESSAAASTTNTTLPADNTIPQITEGAAYTDLDTTITPISASSRLEITVYFPFITPSSSSVGIRFCIFRDAGPDALFTTGMAGITGSWPTSFTVSTPSNATVSTTFTIRWGVSSGTGYINRSGATAALWGGSMKASMTVKEIA